VGEQCKQVGRRDHVQFPGPGGLAALRSRAYQALILARCVNRGKKYARRGRDPPVERQFTHSHIVRQRFSVGGTDCRQQAQGDRKVVVRALLWKVGGRQVDGDDLGRKREADRRQRCTHALAAFGDCLVRKPDDRELGNSGGKLDLDLDRTGVEPEIGDSGDGGGHLSPPPAG